MAHGFEYNRDCDCGGCRVGGRGDHVPPMSAKLRAEAEARGREAVYAEIRKLPTPIVLGFSDYVCTFCGNLWPRKNGEIPPHPANDCLWFKAHASVPSPGAGETKE